MSEDYGRKRLQLCGARLRERSAPQVYIPRIEPRATWGRGGRYLKILGNTVEAHLRGGGLECFLDYDDATALASPDREEANSLRSHRSQRSAGSAEDPLIPGHRAEEVEALLVEVVEDSARSDFSWEA